MSKATEALRMVLEDSPLWETAQKGRTVKHSFIFPRDKADLDRAKDKTEFRFSTSLWVGKYNISRYGSGDVYIYSLASDTSKQINPADLEKTISKLFEDSQ